MTCAPAATRFSLSEVLVMQDFCCCSCHALPHPCSLQQVLFHDPSKQRAMGSLLTCFLLIPCSAYSSSYRLMALPWPSLAHWRRTASPDSSCQSIFLLPAFFSKNNLDCKSLAPLVQNPETAFLEAHWDKHEVQGSYDLLVGISSGQQSILGKEITIAPNMKCHLLYIRYKYN